MLVLTDFEKAMLELTKASSSRGRHSIRNAWEHLSKAWAIKEIDPEMGGFRAITAEEEASSGLIWALQYRGYANAQLLDPRNHVHKHSICPFLEVLSDFFAKTAGKAGIVPSLKIGADHDPRRLKIFIPIVINGKQSWAVPEPPLNLTLRDSTGLVDFAQGIQRLASAKNAARILDYIKAKANERNKILYASERGFPTIECLSESYLRAQKDKVANLTAAFLLIEPYSEVQTFVQQCLSSLLKMLKIARIDSCQDHIK